MIIHKKQSNPKLRFHRLHNVSMEQPTAHKDWLFIVSHSIQCKLYIQQQLQLYLNGKCVVLREPGETNSVEVNNVYVKSIIY